MTRSVKPSPTLVAGFKMGKHEANPTDYRTTGRNKSWHHRRFPAGFVDLERQEKEEGTVEPSSAMT